MKIKYLILLSIIICLSIFKINCLEQDSNQNIDQDQKIEALGHEILRLFENKLKNYFCAEVRFNKIKEYAHKKGDLTQFVNEAIEWRDINLIKFLLAQNNNSVNNLFYINLKNIENKVIKVQEEINKIAKPLEYQKRILKKFKKIYNLISYNQYINNNANDAIRQDLMPSISLPKELIKIIIGYYNMTYEEFCEDSRKKLIESFKNNTKNVEEKNKEDTQKKCCLIQ